METKTVDIYKDTTDLKGLLAQVSEGIEIIFVENDAPVARMHPINKRVAGLHSGLIWTSDDFDEPLSDDFWAGNQ